MTAKETLAWAQAVLVLGSDDDTCSAFLDPVWLKPGESGVEAIEQVSKHRNSYTGGGVVLTAAELRELADSLDRDTPETVKSALLDTAAGYEDLLCEDCYQELAAECKICSQLRLEAARDEAGS